MNAVEIYKRFQRLQGGTGEVRGKEAPFAQNGKWWWEKTDAEQSDEEYNQAYEAYERQLDAMGADEGDIPPPPIGGSYKTIGVEIDGKEVQIPMYRGQDPQGAEEMARMRLEWGLDPFATDAELEAKQNAAHQGPDDASALPQQYAEGTNYVGGPNYDPSYPGPTNPKEFGSGHATAKGVGTGVGTVSNFFFPGLGLLTGPAASWATRMLQSGMSRDAVQKAVQDYQAGGGQSDDTGGGTDTTSQTPTAPAAPATNAPPSAGIGIDPEGNPADPGEFWSNDFGRWSEGDKYGTTPGNYWNQAGPGGPPGSLGLGFNVGGSGTVGNWGTAIGFSGNMGGGAGAGDLSRFMGSSGGGHGYSADQYNLSPSTHGWGQGPDYGNIPGATSRADYDQYLDMFHRLGSVGSSTGPGGEAQFGIGGPQGFVKNLISASQGHKVANVQQQAMGTSSVNPGLKLFHAKQKRKKK